jgi:hypothetical protein
MVFNALGPDNALRRAAMAKAPNIVPWITEQCQRSNLLPEGFGADIYAAADAGEITDHEAGLLVRSLLSAGVDTTVTAIGSALWAFARNPAQFERLRADPKLARNAFEEALRLTSPVHSFCRTAAAKTTVGGIEIEEGTKILCVLGAANLDGEQWEQPDAFDIGRRVSGHLALGVGIHACVGQNIARGPTFSDCEKGAQYHAGWRRRVAPQQRDPRTRPSAARVPLTAAGEQRVRSSWPQAAGGASAVRKTTRDP